MITANVLVLILWLMSAGALRNAKKDPTVDHGTRVGIAIVTMVFWTVLMVLSVINLLTWINQ